MKKYDQVAGERATSESATADRSTIGCTLSEKSVFTADPFFFMTLNVLMCTLRVVRSWRPHLADLVEKYTEHIVRIRRWGSISGSF